MPQEKPLEIKALIADKQFLSGNSRLSESIEDYPEGIIIPIDKPYRWTSADVIRKVKWAACRHFHKKNLKVGHAGTLDPLATGVLLVCIGKATKLAETLQRRARNISPESRSVPPHLPTTWRRPLIRNIPLKVSRKNLSEKFCLGFLANRSRSLPSSQPSPLTGSEPTSWQGSSTARLTRRRLT